MKKLILTFDVLNGVDDQTAFGHGIKLASLAMNALRIDIVNPTVGIEVKVERRTHAVEVA
jgi:hypothetical protein